MAMRILSGVALALSLVACDRGDAGPAAPAEVAEPSPKLDAVEQVHRLLLARHPQDLPDRAALERIDGAPVALAQIMRTDPQLVVRARAAELFAAYADHREEAMAVVRDPAVPSKVRAAALLGLSAAEPDAGVRTLVVEVATGADPRLAVEATELTARSPAFAAQKAELLAHPSLAPELRARLAAPAPGRVEPAPTPPG